MSTRIINLEDCSLAVRLSEAAYWCNPEATAEAKALGFSRVSHLGNNGGAHCLVCENDRRVIIAVRGTQTDDLFDLFSDSWAIPRRDYQGGFVHRGFYKYCTRIWMEVEPFVVGADGRELWFVGHSLGGIAAQIFGAWSGVLRRRGNGPLAHVISVGAPMGATSGFLRAMEQQTFSITRITNNLDPVTMAPLWPLYRHPNSRHLHFMSDGRLTWNPTWQDRIRDLPKSLCRTAVSFFGQVLCRLSIIKALLHVMNQHDHLIVNYRQLVDRHVADQQEEELAERFDRYLQGGDFQ